MTNGDHAECRCFTGTLHFSQHSQYKSCGKRIFLLRIVYVTLTADTLHSTLQVGAVQSVTQLTHVTAGTVATVIVYKGVL